MKFEAARRPGVATDVHAARRQAKRALCAAHGHPLHGKAWSALGELLAALDQDVCAFCGDHAVYAAHPDLGPA